MMNKATRIWRQIGPRIYGLALMMKVGIPLVFILSMAIGGYLIFSAISEQVADFQKEVAAQFESIENSAEVLMKPIEDLSEEFGKVMAALKPVVNTVNKIGDKVSDLWPFGDLKLSFLRLPTIPNFDLVIDEAKNRFQEPLQKMSDKVRQAYALAKKVAAIVSVAFVLWVMALIVVFGAHWYREFVHGWKLVLHGAVSAPMDSSTDVQTQIDVLKAELSSRNMSRPSGGSKGSLWLVMLAFLLLFLYAWNAQNRLFELLKNRPVVTSHTTVEAKPPPPDPVVQSNLMTLDGKLVFEAGSAVVTMQGRQSVKSLVPEILIRLAQEQDRVLIVGGHTDDVPIKHAPFISNRALSFARASAVAQLLIDSGLPAQRVVAVGFGASRPRIPNEDAVSRHLNRRVELLLAPMKALRSGIPGA